MPDDMREFADRRTRGEGLSTPTEDVRSLIRQDRRRVERDQLARLILTWLSDGELTRERLEAILDRAPGRAAVATGKP